MIARWRAARRPRDRRRRARYCCAARATPRATRRSREARRRRPHLHQADLADRARHIRVVAALGADDGIDDLERNAATLRRLLHEIAIERGVLHDSGAAGPPRRAPRSPDPSPGAAGVGLERAAGRRRMKAAAKRSSPPIARPAAHWSGAAAAEPLVVRWPGPWSKDDIFDEMAREEKRSTGEYSPAARRIEDSTVSAARIGAIACDAPDTAAVAAPRAAAPFARRDG